MLARAMKLWNEHCKPKREVKFRVIDKEKEELPPEIENENLLEVFFVT